MAILDSLLHPPIGVHLLLQLDFNVQVAIELQICVAIDTAILRTTASLEPNLREQQCCFQLSPLAFRSAVHACTIGNLELNTTAPRVHGAVARKVTHSPCLVGLPEFCF